jgi:hypothetical protein
MQIDPLQARTNPEPLSLDSKAKAPPPEPALVHNQPAPVEQHAVAPIVLAAAEHVTVSFDTSRELVYRFVDAKTGDVISQTPPEQVLAVVRGIQDLLRAEERSKEPGINVRG